MLSAKYIHINMDKNKRPKLYTLPDTLQALQPPRRRPDLPGVACPASGRACWCAWSALHLARSAPPPVLCNSSRCTGGWGLHRRGIQPPPSPAR